MNVGVRRATRGQHVPPSERHTGADADAQEEREEADGAACRACQLELTTCEVAAQQENDQQKDSGQHTDETHALALLDGSRVLGFCRGIRTVDVRRVDDYVGTEEGRQSHPQRRDQGVLVRGRAGQDRTHVDDVDAGYIEVVATDLVQKELGRQDNDGDDEAARSDPDPGEFRQHNAADQERHQHDVRKIPQYAGQELQN